MTNVRLALDPRNRWLHSHRLLTPTGRLLTLAPAAAAALRALQTGTTDPRALALGRRLVSAGAAHPRPTARRAADVTVVVPVKDRVGELARCLAALAHDDVLVIDDGSADGAAIESTCTEHAARYVRRANGGPAAARNTALPLLHKEFVAFVDSDCEVPPGWLDALRGHFDDASVAAVAPRVTGGPRSPLDLGPHEGAVRPGTAVPYVPTAALLVRRAALQPFDEDLRYGEDVDLVWRLVAQGWQIRYDPSVVVQHQEPVRLRDRWVRRYRYGTSAAPLSRRHPGAVRHLALTPWPTAVVVLLLARRPWLALAAGAVATGRLDRSLQHPPTSARLVGASTAATAGGIGRFLQLAGPVAWWAATRDRRVAGLVLLPAVHEWWYRGRPEALHRYVPRLLADQATYGAGVAQSYVVSSRRATARPRGSARSR